MSIRRLAVGVAALLIGAMLSAPAVHAAPRPAWQVYAIRYGTLRAFPVHDLVAGADTSRTLDIAMMFWLLNGQGRHVLVDAGFYRPKFVDAWKPADYRTPADAVRQFGLSPDSITDIVISHVHWDHLDGADLFPNARVWIQREEYAWHVGPGGVPLHAAIDTLDAAMLDSLNRLGRVSLIDGDAREFLPGLTAYTGGKHTYASQYVGVRTARHTVVVASDNVYLYENLDRHVPIAQTLDAKSNLAAQDRMKTIASQRRLIVPGHDPAVFVRFPAVRPGVVRID